jgi:hypothetical protein
MSTRIFPVRFVVILLLVLASGIYLAADYKSAQPLRSTKKRAEDLVGYKLTVDKTGQAIGVIDGLVTDAAGDIEYLIVSQGDRMLTVPSAAVAFNIEKRRGTVQITREKLDKIPTFTEEDYPTFSSAEYRAKTYQYFGVTPAKARPSK